MKPADRNPADLAAAFRNLRLTRATKATTYPADLDDADLRAALDMVSDDLHARGILCDLDDARLYRLDLNDLRAAGLDLDPATRQLRLYVTPSTPNPNPSTDETS